MTMTVKKPTPENQKSNPPAFYDLQPIHLEDRDVLCLRYRRAFKLETALNAGEYADTCRLVMDTLRSGAPGSVDEAMGLLRERFSAAKAMEGEADKMFWEYDAQLVALGRPSGLTQNDPISANIAKLRAQSERDLMRLRELTMEIASIRSNLESAMVRAEVEVSQ